MENNYYVYIYLDPRKPGKWEYDGVIFNHQPFYIGKGIGNRMTNHLRPYLLRDTTIKANIINKILQETQNPPSILKIYENLTNEEAIDREIKMIEYFGRIDKKTGILANMSKGGEGAVDRVLEKSVDKSYNRGKFTAQSKRIDQFDLNGNFIRKWDWVNAIVQELGLRSTNIVACCAGRVASYAGFIWKYDGTSPFVPNFRRYKKEKTLKEVFQYDQNGKFIKSYETAANAARSVGLSSGTLITECCQGLCKTAGNYFWFFSFLGDRLSDFPQKMPFQKSTVYQKDSSGNIVNQYFSILKAAKEIKGNRSAIIAAAYKGSIYKGFLWEVVDKLLDKKIYKYTKEGFFVREYRDIYEAMSLGEIVGNAELILKSCRSKFMEAYGFIWKFNFYKNGLKEGYSSENVKIIQKLDLQERVIVEFMTIKDVCENLGVKNNSSILSACHSNNLSTYKGFYWKFKDEN